jgi:coenzyme F420-dependent glucose-6-phosphate dehydrogenase
LVARLSSLRRAVAATVEELSPGRAFLGIGSGEALNEVPCGMDWPDTGDQVRRMEEALEIIGRLLEGERVDHEGRFFRTKGAFLHTRGERRPPVYVSAFGPDAAAVAARHGDGLWTLADPLGALATYREKVLPALEGARV